MSVELKVICTSIAYVDDGGIGKRLTNRLDYSSHTSEFRARFKR